MLKLERVDTSRKISVRMRHKERFLNRIFLTALSIAAVLHFLPFILFSVAPFNIRESYIVIPPGAVSAEIDSPDALVNTSAQEADLPTKNLGLLAPRDMPEIAARHPLAPFPEISYTTTTLASSQPFTQTDYPPSLTAPLPVHYPPLAIHISGPLAEHVPIYDHETIVAMQPVTMQQQAVDRERVVYNVQYDRRQQHLFWLEPVYLSSRRDLNQKAEQLIRSLHFQEGSDNFMTGQVEIIFTTIRSS